MSLRHLHRTRYTRSFRPRYTASFYITIMRNPALCGESLSRNARQNCALANTCGPSKPFALYIRRHHNFLHSKEHTYHEKIMSEFQLIPSFPMSETEISSKRNVTQHFTYVKPRRSSSSRSRPLLSSKNGYVGTFLSGMYSLYLTFVRPSSTPGLHQRDPSIIAEFGKTDGALLLYTT